MAAIEPERWLERMPGWELGASPDRQGEPCKLFEWRSCFDPSFPCEIWKRYDVQEEIEPGSQSQGQP